VKPGGNILIVFGIAAHVVVAPVVIFVVLGFAGFVSANMPWKEKFPVLSRLLGSRVEVNA